MRILTMAVCHNRREKTLRALDDLHRQVLPAGTRVAHVLVDDASGDGTAEAVAGSFPDVEIFQGSGSLYWAGGMRYGWDRIRDREFDYLFVYNDDVHLYEDALGRLMACFVAHAGPDSRIGIAVGSFSDPSGFVTTYGGQVREKRWHPLRFRRVDPRDQAFEVDTLNMNGALISSALLCSQGFLSDYFVHSGADFDYGSRVRNAGWKILAAPGYVGWCERNRPAAVQGGSVAQRLRRRHDDKRVPIRVHFHNCRAHCGWAWPFFFLSPYLKILIGGIGAELSSKWRLPRLLARAGGQIVDVARLRYSPRKKNSADGVEGVIVSLTSFPERIRHVWIPIETIFRQSCPPEKVVLVLAEDEFPEKRLPRSILRQVGRGLEILWTKRNGRSYNKLIPVRQAYPNHTVVTIDDDVVYRPDLLSELLAASSAAPDAVIGHRGRIMLYHEGKLAPYATWPKATEYCVSEHLFLTGVGGVLYPPSDLSGELLLDLDLAERLCPTADDIWFWAVARKTGVRLICLGDDRLDELLLQRWSRRLLSVNSTDEGNDQQLLNVIGYFGLNHPMASMAAVGA